MENILNIDKAIEIAQKHHVIYDDYYDSIQECIESCREAMEWKDERHQQEKQQWIDKAADFISKRFYIGINNHITSKEDYYSLTELIRDFEQTMKGE